MEPLSGTFTCRAYPHSSDRRYHAIKFLATQAKISELDAYALCSIAVSFRVTQVVDIVRGVHALIPKNIFAKELRQQMKMV